MKIRIIELLEMIANGQKPPKKIMYDNKLWEYDVQDKDYWTNHYDGTEWLFDECVITAILNDEVEILETTITYKQDNIQHKKIEPLKYEVVTMFAEDKPIKEEIYIDNKDLLKTISEIIDKVNELCKKH